MSTLDDVFAWSKTLKPWQADAVRRLISAGEVPLTAQDQLEILSLAKADLELEALPPGLKPISPTLGAVSGSAITGSSIGLVSIRDVRDVNILKPGETLRFAESGVTVVYGDNGSGKSGYSRILKLACRARDKEEEVLPNIFSQGPVGVPSATIRIAENGIPRDVLWTKNGATDPALSNVCVFDSRCARVITDDRNQISYLPYGCDVFEKLVKVVLQVKAVLEAEIKDPVTIRDSAVVQGTPSAQFLEELGEKTKDESIDAATLWSVSDEDLLKLKEDLARASDPAKANLEIARLKKVAARISEFARASSELALKCSEVPFTRLREAAAELRAAQDARNLALAERRTEEPLSGVATTSQWRILYEAAKTYSEVVAYPGVKFPKTDDAVCVLCQQSIGDEAAARFDRFRRFMEDATSAVLAKKQDALDQFKKNVINLAPQGEQALESINAEIAALDVQVAEAFLAFHRAVLKSKNEALAVLSGSTDSGPDPLKDEWPTPPAVGLNSLALKLGRQVAEIIKATEPEENQKLQTEVTSLRARKALNKRRTDIEDFASQSRRNGALRSASESLNTKEITRQGTLITSKALTPALKSAIRTEAVTLGATRIPISVKPVGTAGETTHEMVLDGVTTKSKAPMSAVLSEGEARVIAIAGFLAELSLVPNSNPIVFDDPASSLDHKFVGKVAARIAKEGLKRQVIVFSHNIAFLMELDDAATALGLSGTPVGITVQTIRREDDTAGVTTGGVPWYGLKVKERVNQLELLTHQFKGLYPGKMSDYNERASYVYGLLREAWEACIEDDLFYSVVCRYRNSVQTLKLEQVSIEDSDVYLIELNMSKASAWMRGHDKSKALDQDRPAPDALLADLATLREFSKELLNRRKETEKRRQDQLKA